MPLFVSYKRFHLAAFLTRLVSDHAFTQEKRSIFNLTMPWPTKDTDGPLCHIFAKILRGQFFKYETNDDFGYCNYSLLFYVIFCNLFSISIDLYCLHGMFVKTKTLFCIKVFLLTNQKKNVLILSQLEKIPTQRDQKQFYINVRR